VSRPAEAPQDRARVARRVATDFRIIDKGRMVKAGKMGELSDEMVKHHLSV